MNTFFLAFLAFLACWIWNCRQAARECRKHEMPAGWLVSRTHAARESGSTNPHPTWTDFEASLWI
jgi:hypothetical protein